MNSFYIDFHCHPAMKPYGQSFKETKRENPTNRKKKNSIWHYDPPTQIDKLVNYVGKLTKFRQSDFTSLAYGNTNVVCISLYPLEKPFVDTHKFGSSIISDLLSGLATGLGTPRINYLQNLDDYFGDLVEEYNFYSALSNEPIAVDGGKAKYQIVSNYGEIRANQLLNASRKPTDPEIISVVLSIEGAHIFNCASYINNPLTTAAEIEKLIVQLKKLPHPIFFMTFAHHYYNNLCGHATSLNDQLEKISSQHTGRGLPFTPLGWDVLDSLLSKTNGRRILIDIKHMSPGARAEYYHHIKTKYKGEDIPLIVSHGAVNGLHSLVQPGHLNPGTSGKFMIGDINFYDIELVAIAKTNGIFGLQLDERRIANEGTRKKAEGNKNDSEIRYEHARLLWNQVQHIGEILDAENLQAWDIIAIGSDFDGIIDPLNGFWTAEQFPLLEEALSKHAHNYLTNPNPIKNQFNKISVKDLMDKVFRLNGINFLQRYFN